MDLVGTRFVYYMLIGRQPVYSIHSIACLSHVKSKRKEVVSKRGKKTFPYENLWRGARGKLRSALRPFFASPLHAPTLFDIVAPRSMLCLRSALRAFFASPLHAPTLFESSLRAPTDSRFAAPRSIRNTKNQRSALQPIFPSALRAPGPPGPPPVLM